MRETAVFYASWFEAADVLPANDFKDLFSEIRGYIFSDKDEKEVYALVEECIKARLSKEEAR